MQCPPVVNHTACVDTDNAQHVSPSKQATHRTRQPCQIERLHKLDPEKTRGKAVSAWGNLQCPCRQDYMRRAVSDGLNQGISLCDLCTQPWTVQALLQETYLLVGGFMQKLLCSLARRTAGRLLRRLDLTHSQLLYFLQYPDPCCLLLCTAHDTLLHH